eukprot:1001569-Pelagomonas_calceolata.AAC.4
MVKVWVGHAWQGVLVMQHVADGQISYELRKASLTLFATLQDPRYPTLIMRSNHSVMKELWLMPEYAWSSPACPQAYYPPTDHTQGANPQAQDSEIKRPA